MWLPPAPAAVDGNENRERRTCFASREFDSGAGAQVPVVIVLLVLSAYCSLIIMGAAFLLFADIPFITCV